MKVESIAECFPWSILQYFCPSSSDNWFWKPIFVIIYESGRFTQVLLYTIYIFDQSLKPHSHCAGVATVHPDAGRPVYRDAPGHIS